MALRQSKTTIEKQETKDEPQKNGSYKIRQIIMKIMEYTHIHTHPGAKWKQSNKNTVDWSSENLPVKNKTNLSTNWKTKLKQGAKWGIKQWKQK